MSSPHDVLLRATYLPESLLAILALHAAVQQIGVSSFHNGFNELLFCQWAASAKKLSHCHFWKQYSWNILVVYTPLSALIIFMFTP